MAFNTINLIVVVHSLRHRIELVYKLQGCPVKLKYLFSPSNYSSQIQPPSNPEIYFFFKKNTLIVDPSWSFPFQPKATIFVNIHICPSDETEQPKQKKKVFLQPPILPPQQLSNPFPRRRHNPPHRSIGIILSLPSLSLLLLLSCRRLPMLLELIPSISLNP